MNSKMLQLTTLAHDQNITFSTQQYKYEDIETDKKSLILNLQDCKPTNEAERCKYKIQTLEPDK